MISARWKRNVEPPARPSELLALALRDIEWVEKNPKYDIDMTIWFSRCSVCFAGAVMVRRFKIPDDRCCPSNFTHNWNRAFWSLNAFRNGDITDALSNLGIERELGCIKISPYCQGPSAFKRDILRLIKLLRKEKL